MDGALDGWRLGLKNSSFRDSRCVSIVSFVAGSCSFTYHVSLCTGGDLVVIGEYGSEVLTAHGGCVRPAPAWSTQLGAYVVNSTYRVFNPKLIYMSK